VLRSASRLHPFAPYLGLYAPELGLARTNSPQFCLSTASGYICQSACIADTAFMASIPRYPWNSFFNNSNNWLSRKLVYISPGRCGNSPSLTVATETCYNTSKVSIVT
jgi:hypothetical protein